jgi:Epoxide hydrolase N terminus
LSTREETDSVAIVADAEIRPFHVEVPQEQIDDLRRRIQTTRWPEAFRSLR